MTAPLDVNVLAYMCQLAVVACAAWVVALACRIRAPRLLLWHYQGALIVGLLFPLLQTFRAVRPATSSPVCQCYAEALLESACGDWALRLRPASTWLQARHLRARILWIAHGGSMSRKHFVASAVAALVFVCLSGLSGIYAFPLEQSGARIYETQDEGVSMPRVVIESKPTYTPEAMKAKVQGSMTVSAVVEPDGTVGDVRILRSVDRTYGLDEQGLAAARRWRFRPGTRGGKPVAVRVDLEFRFTLK